MAPKVISLLVALLLIGAPAAAQVGRNTGNLVYLDVASEAELSKLPHVTPALAKEIVAKRPFKDASALDAALTGLTADQKKELYGKAFLPINLNTASEAEILLIPGMNKRMAHEFEEYRPYTSLEQFRKEIGKYVDQKEVARLESYVFIPMNLNTASEEAFATIPGMTKRMVHEFEEYRPYQNIEQFRKEIGKYVDKNEVARYERYVVLK
ncbi:MAG: helix-hairpin-helix domain-containing protein [Rhodospirillaceae bacterium]